MSNTEKLILRIDPSSLKEADCSMKFQYMNRIGYTSKYPDHKIEWGSAFHLAIASWLRGADKMTALKKGMEYFIMSNCNVPEKDKRTAGCLATAILGYIDKYSSQDSFIVAKNEQGEYGVELSYAIPFKSYDTVDVLLCGVVDAIGTKSGIKCFKDIKTTSYNTDPKYYFDDYRVSIQMLVYSYVLRTIGFCDYYPPCIIDGVFVKGENNINFQRSELIDFPEFLVGQALEWVGEKVDELVKRVVEDKWTRNFSRCKTQFGNCQFMNVCSKPIEYQEAILDEGFAKRIYNPATFNGAGE